MVVAIALSELAVNGGVARVTDEDISPIIDPVILRMGLFLDGISLDMMMIVERERSFQWLPMEV
jgi:hypothetical protein